MAELARGWTWICYPESAPENWIEQLNRLHLQFAVSPLHDADVNADDTEKKHHWHVYCTFPGKKSFDQILALSQGICKGTIPKKVENPIGLIRYFIHLDNPEKTQYKREDIQTFGGLDIDSFFEVSKMQQLRKVAEIIKYCKARRINYFMDLVDELIVEENYDWLFICLNTNTLAITNYLRSGNEKRHEIGNIKN